MRARSRLQGWSRLLVVLLAASLLVIAASRPLAAQTPVSGDLQPRYRLLGTADEDAQFASTAAASPYLPPRDDERQPRKLLGALVIGMELAVTAGKGVVGHQVKSFHVTREQFFGASTLDGGADKAAHFADYFVLSKEFAYIFGKLGFSESAALLMGLGTAMVGGAPSGISSSR